MESLFCDDDRYRLRFHQKNVSVVGKVAVAFKVACRFHTLGINIGCLREIIQTGVFSIGGFVKNVLRSCVFLDFLKLIKILFHIKAGFCWLF